MIQQNAKRTKGFTLVELLVVVTIILIMTGISLPSVVGFMKTRRLKSAAQIMQTACIQARSAAIAQREKHFVVVYLGNSADPEFADPVNTATTVQLKGSLRHVYVFDSNENGTKVSDQIGTPVELPEFVNVTTPNNTSFALVFRSNGSMELFGVNGGQTAELDTQPNFPATADMRFTQSGTTLQCIFDIVPTTGRVLFEVREP